MKKDTLFISVCILAYNRKNDVIKSISYIKKNTYKHFEIIVVDNGSTDGTDKAISEKFPEVKYIKNTNEGISGWNVGFKKAKGSIILALDDDSHPASDALQKIADAFSTKPELLIISCNIINFSNKKSVYHARQSENTPQKTFTFMGCGVAINTNVFKKIGYFASWMFVYAHEIEFSLRALKKGIDIWFYPDIIVYHRESQANRTSARFIYYCTRNFLIIAWIYFPFFYALTFTIAFLGESFLSAVKNKQTIAWLKALIGWLKSGRLIMHERNTLSYKTLYPVVKRFLLKQK